MTLVFRIAGMLASVDAPKWQRVARSLKHNDRWKTDISAFNFFFLMRILPTTSRLLQTCILGCIWFLGLQVQSHVHSQALVIVITLEQHDDSASYAVSALISHPWVWIHVVNHLINCRWNKTFWESKSIVPLTLNWLHSIIHGSGAFVYCRPEEVICGFDATTCIRPCNVSIVDCWAWEALSNHLPLLLLQASWRFTCLFF